MGLRERKKQATRAALSWAAIQLVVERGFDNVLVEDIANAAGVSPRTFNNYFSSKAEAVAARHLDRSAKMAEDLRDRPADEPLWTAIRHALLAQLEPGPEVADHPVGNRERWAAGISAMMAAPSLQAEFLRAGATAETEVAAAVAERTKTVVGRNLYPSLVAAAVNAANMVCQQQYLQGDAQADMKSLLIEALDLIEAGLPDPSA
ncbi:TetR family transcriptional regulator [Hamadaea sp. NPDC050747]|uniref:acyl-CoA-like ligand-binding transcription factor n=1 Tax=Hamadaea sp. NPDC050747 TaxID=3155789 RepID=UPI0033DBB6BE